MPPKQIQIRETAEQKLNRLMLDPTVMKVTIFKTKDGKVLKIVGTR